MLQERKKRLYMMMKKKKRNSGMLSSRADNGTAGVAILIESSSSTTTTNSVIFDDDENMVVEILSRLPVRSLLRFKCVSKRWCSLIQDPYFVDLHSARSITRPGATFFISRYYRGFYISFFGSTSYDGPNFYAVDYVSFIGDPGRRIDTFGPHFYIQRYYSYYNKLTSTQILKNAGLLLMSFKEETVWIINPSIRKTILLTKTNFKEEEAIKNKDVVHPVGIHWMNLDYVVEPKYGFGFDPVTKKYKVICICKIEKYYVPPQFFLYDPIECGDHEFYPQLLTIYYRCKVLTIEDVVDCCWRRIDEIPARHLTGDPIYLNGALYWTSLSLEDDDDDQDVLLKKKNDQDVIVAFDISTEKFSVIKTPADFVAKPSGLAFFIQALNQELYEVDGCLAILDNNTTGPNTIEIWKLVVVEPAAAAAAGCCWVKETILTLSFDWRKEGYLFEIIGETNQILLKRSSPGTSFCYYNRDNYLVDDHENKTKKTSTCDDEKQLEFTGMAASFTEIQLPGTSYRSFHTCTESLWSLNSSSN